MKISQIELEERCRAFLKDNYNLELSIPVKINPRLSTTLGSFIYNFKKNEPIEIEFSNKFLQHGEIEDILSTIRHECIHYALFMLGKPFKDGEKYFEDELIKHGAPSTDKVVFKTKRNVRVYNCKCDEHIFLATIRPSECKSCNGMLKYVGRRKQLV